MTTSQDVFGLVLVSWSVLAVAFGPLLVVYALGRRPSQPLAIVMMAGALAVMFGWRWLGWHDYTYEILPGICVGLAIYLAGRLVGADQAAQAGREPEVRSSGPEAASRH